MATHLATRARRYRAGSVLIALGVALAVFALLDGPEPRTSVDAGGDGADSSAPTVLGAVVTRGADAPLAEPAEPATFELPKGTSRRRTDTPDTRTDDPTPPPTLYPAWSVENTTPTTAAGTTSSTEQDTTTPTEGSTTTIEQAQGQGPAVS